MNELKPTDWPRIVRPGARVFIGSGAGVPRKLIDGLLAAGDRLRDVELVHIHTLGATPWIDKKYAAQFRTNTFFMTPEVGQAVIDGRADYTPCSLSEVPKLFKSTLLPVDVALVTVSPPDENGNMTLGVSVDVVRAAVDSARVVVAQINRHMPRTHGGAVIHAADVHYYLEGHMPLPVLERPENDAVRSRIGGYLAELVEDGSTLQVGIGHTPQTVIASLAGHQRLGIHTGMLSDALIDLIKCGAVDNSRKHFQAGTTIASHAIGSRAVYDFVNDNPEVSMHSSEWVNDPSVIALNHKMVAVNGARLIDITGQVVRDSAGDRYYGGIGAQIDFLRGATASPGGRPVYVLPSTNADQTESRIVAGLTEGTSVATGRTDVQYIITEYGVAALRGLSIRDRALEMIQIAHPKFREELLRGAHARGWIPKFVSLAPTSVKPDDMTSGVEFQRLVLGKDRTRNFYLRPLHPSDIRRLQQFFYSHSEETVRWRYGYLRENMPADSAYELVGVDQTRDLALGIFEEAHAGGAPELRSVGRFYQDDDGKSAEIAFVVHDERRRMGMASILLEQLADIASARGIERFWAEVMTGNRPMRQLFEKYGATSKRSQDTDGFVCSMEVARILDLAKQFKSERGEKLSGEAAPSYRVGWFWSETCLKHDTGPGQVETPQRYQVLGDRLRGLAETMDAVPLRGREATRAELLRCHAAHYLDVVHIDVENLADQLRTGDTPICPESERVAKLAVGAGLEAVDRVMTNEITRAFVAVRPPGHHATPDRGMGFCIYNNIALMARHAQEVHGVKRVLIVDWDVHHGNGTQDIFSADPSVFCFSTHQQGIYPFSGGAEETGAGPGRGTVMNFPLPEGSGREQILPLITGALTEAMESFQPDLVLISAGFDARIDDPVGDFTLTDEDFADLTRAVGAISERWAGGRMISILEGGYNPEGLASAAAAHFEALFEG